MEPITQRTFKNRLVERGITEGRMGKARYWRGIRQIVESDKSDKREPFPIKPLHKEDIEKNAGKRVSSVTSRLKKKSLVTKVTQNDDIPDYPSRSCHVCRGSDYWLSDDNKWLCQKCHPDPKKGK